MPLDALGPLAYWILLNSCAAYWLLTWGNRHATAGYVLAYCAQQPVVATLLTVAIISSGLPVAPSWKPSLIAEHSSGMAPQNAANLISGLVRLGERNTSNTGRWQHAHACPDADVRCSTKIWQCRHSSSDQPAPARRALLRLDPTISALSECPLLLPS